MTNREGWEHIAGSVIENDEENDEFLVSIEHRDGTWQHFRVKHYEAESLIDNLRHALFRFLKRDASGSLIDPEFIKSKYGEGEAQ